MKKSYLEEMFQEQLDEAGIEYEREVMLVPGRKLRWDFVLPGAGIAIELQGGLWLGSRGGHSSARGITKDYLKANEATSLGWMVLMFSTEMVKNGSAIEKVKAMVDHYGIPDPTLPCRAKRELKRAAKRQPAIDAHNERKKVSKKASEKKSKAN